MSHQPLFNKTTRIQKGVCLINDVDDVKYPLLLSRVLQRFGNTDGAFFTTEEKAKLEITFSLSAEDVNHLLDTTIFILQQAAHYICKPAVLQKELQQLEINEKKCDDIVQAWSKSARDVVERLKKQTLCVNQLESVKWQLNLNMGLAQRTRLKETEAIVEFGVRQSQQENCVDDFKKVSVEFNHEELYRFYNQLEVIQSQLDSLQ